MHRSFALIPLLPLAAGCAPSLARAAAPHEAPLAVDVRVATADDKPAVLLSGRMEVEPRRGAQLEHRAPRSAESQRLRVNTVPRGDGTYLVDLHYDEVSNDGRRIGWALSVVVKRGVEATERLSFPGGGRTIALALR